MTPRCLSWEQWEEETWTDSVTLNVALEGGNLVNIDQTVRFRTKWHAGNREEVGILLFQLTAKP